VTRSSRHALSGALFALSGCVLACEPAASPEGATRRSQEEIQRTVRASFGSLEACYDQALARTPSLRGRVTTRFTIGSAGKVVDVETDLPEAQSAFSDCLEDAFRAIAFSPAHAEQRVTYPVDFSPAE
jgi:TonB family protein